MKSNDKMVTSTVNYADSVLINGCVYSIELNGKENRMQAVAVKDGKFVYCGNKEGVKEYIGPNTKTIDLEGKMVLPGFADVHNHMTEMASAIFALDLYPYTSKIEYLGAAAQWRRDHPDCTFITGNGWSLSNLGNTYPTKEELDQICPDIPAAFFDTSHHVLWANSKALEHAGVTKDTPDPPGGVIERNLEKEPTGIFFEAAASNLIMIDFPEFDVWQYKTAIQAYQQMANSFGITLSQDCFVKPGSNAIKAFKELAQEGLFTMRIRGAYGLSPAIDGNHFKTIESAEKDFGELIGDLAEKRKEDRIGELFQMNAVKIFEDGGGHTCFMKEPFEDTEDCGQTVWPDDQLKSICRKAENAGFQIHVHAMGDAAISTTLDAFQYANDKGSEKRHTITHLMLVDENDMQRLADLKVVGAPQPFWMCRDDYYSRLYFPLLGEKRTNRLYPMKSLVDKGVVMASASDWPITNPCPPLTAIQCGVTRIIPYDDPDIPMMNLKKNPEFRYPLGPDDNRTKECTDLKTMIQSVTISGAYATFLEDLTGSIEAGKSADMVIIDKNLFDVSNTDISKANVMMTIFRGEVVYQANTVTVSNRDIVIRKTSASFEGAQTPYSLTVAYGTTAQDLAGALNPPVGGTFKILNKGAGVPLDSTISITDDMTVASIADSGQETYFSVSVEAYRKPNHFIVSDVSAQGFLITLDTAVPELMENDVYIMKDSNKVSATTASVRSCEGGKAYRIEADDWNSKNGLISGEKYEVYVYAEGFDFSEHQIIIIP